MTWFPPLCLLVSCVILNPSFAFQSTHTHSLAFETFDLNRNDILDLNEFHILVNDLFNFDSAKRISPKQVTKLYDMLDLTGDGVIDRTEFIKIWHHWVQPVLNPTSVLLVLNLQNDYLRPWGSMYLKGGQTIVSTINSLIEHERFKKVFFIRDYHPANHCSFNVSESANNHWSDEEKMVVDEQDFEETYECVTRLDLQQVLWPRHCVQGTSGVEFYPQLVTKEHITFINKGTEATVDSYSALLDNSGKWLKLRHELDKLDNDGKLPSKCLDGLLVFNLTLFLKTWL